MSTKNNPIGDVAASLGTSVSHSVQKYFAELNGTDPVGLYRFVIEAIEVPLFRAVMEHCKGNQSKAADLMGISRGTLRTKLKTYFDDQYVYSAQS